MFSKGFKLDGKELAKIKEEILKEKINNMKVAVLFSGGKDSTMAVYNALENGDNG